MNQKNGKNSLGIDICFEEQDNPIELFKNWFAKAEKNEINDPNAVAVATSDTNNQPNVRMVLLKGLSNKGFVFYTNFNSKKGSELKAVQKASMCFHWKSLRRQITILGKVGDNFAAGMTGGMAFIYNESKEFEKKINPDSVIWQNIETDYWIDFLKKLVKEHFIETNSHLSKKIIDNFDNEIKNFIQVCPKEMLDKLDNPITLKKSIKEVS